MRSGKFLCLLFFTMIMTAAGIVDNAGFFGRVLYCRCEETKEQLKLYAKSAVLMDGVSGRILYEKDSGIELPMASTTKIMTCILALELAHQKDVVTVSAKASSMPKVRLGMVENEQFILSDLLYSLMLESHNDSAVAIAEHVAGSVEAFASMMNQKARDIGCYHTYFITPNGLDASITDKSGMSHQHHTTAADLARIMRYCIMDSPAKEQFLEITRTPTHSFTNVKGTRSFSCSNHNAFLTMMDGALSGKTGFTAKAGYCYVGALQRDGKTFVVALLACGWPNHKTYKWSDTKLLMNYGLDHYEYREVYEPRTFDKIPVAEGIPAAEEDGEQAYVMAEADYGEEGESVRLLLEKNETVTVESDVQKKLKAPVEKNTVVGYVRYLLNGETVKEVPVVTRAAVDKKTGLWSMRRVLHLYFEMNTERREPDT